MFTNSLLFIFMCIVAIGSKAVLIMKLDVFLIGSRFRGTGDFLARASAKPGFCSFFGFRWLYPSDSDGGRVDTIPSH